MKIREAIETVDRLLSNQYETPDKVRWLSELDGIVYRDIICTHATVRPGTLPAASGAASSP